MRIDRQEEGRVGLWSGSAMVFCSAMCDFEHCSASPVLWWRGKLSRVIGNIAGVQQRRAWKACA